MQVIIAEKSTKEGRKLPLVYVLRQEHTLALGLVAARSVLIMYCLSKLQVKMAGAYIEGKKTQKIMLPYQKFSEMCEPTCF